MATRSYNLLLLLFFASFVHASTIDSIDLWIQGDGFVWVEEKLTLTDGVYEVGLPYDVKDLTILSSRGPLQFNLTFLEPYSRVLFKLRKPLEMGESETIWIKYGTQKLTSKKEGVWFINFNSEATPRKTIVKVNYPVGSQILSLQPTSLLRTPEKYALILYPQEQDFYFNCSYQYTGTQPVTTVDGNITSTTMGEEGGLLLGKEEFYLLTALLLIALISIFYLIWRRRSESNEPLTYSVNGGLSNSLITGEPNVSSINSLHGVKGGLKDSVINMLDETELDIVRLLENSEEEELTQAYIYKTTGIPKSTLSEKLKQLEKRKIINRTKEGRTNWINLQEWVFLE
jgi:uncharacterized membrane protein